MRDLDVETYERNGLQVTISYDDMAENPLGWCEPEERQGKVRYALHNRRYDLPYEIEADTDDFDGWPELAAAVTKKGGELAGYKYKFVNWYEHSGIVITLQDNDTRSDYFDAGIAGVIFGKTIKAIENEFAPYKAYVEGDVYGYSIVNPKSGEQIDSCYGYYGAEDVEQAANSEADAYKWPHEAAYAPAARRLHR